MMKTRKLPAHIERMFRAEDTLWELCEELLDWFYGNPDEAVLSIYSKPDGPLVIMKRSAGDDREVMFASGSTLSDALAHANTKLVVGEWKPDRFAKGKK